MNNLPALISTDLKERIEGLEKIPEILDLFQYDDAAQRRKSAKVMLKDLDALRKGLTKPLDDRKKEIMEYFKQFELRLDDFEKHHAKLMIAFDQEQERIRQRKQEELENYMRKKAQEEADKKALAALKRGDEAKAEQILEQVDKEPLAVPQLAPHKPIAQGVHYREDWTFEIVDSTLIPLKYLVPDLKKISEEVKLNKDQAQIAGVRIFSEKVLVQR